MASPQAPSGAPVVKGPPYLPQVWSLGGLPSKRIDIPVTSVFLLLFIAGAAVHMTIFQLNRRRGHKFLMSGILFGFCMARIVTSVLRIASVAEQSNANLDIAALVFTNAGVVILYIVNLIFAQRLIRAQHPSVGWSRPFSWLFRCLYVLIIVTITMVIVVVVQTLFTLSHNTRRIDRDIQLYGLTFFAVAAFLPIPMTLLMLAIPRRPKGRRPDKFGEGRWREKIAILLVSSLLLSLEASYKCGAVWMDPVPITKPMPSYLSKGAFYAVTFTIEVLVVFAYAILRVDLRFHVPDGASKRKTFQTKGFGAEAEAATTRPPRTASTTETQAGSEDSGTQKKEEEESHMRGVFSEEETFDENEEGVYVGTEERQRKDVEMAV